MNIRLGAGVNMSPNDLWWEFKVTFGDETSSVSVRSEGEMVGAMSPSATSTSNTQGRTAVLMHISCDREPI